MTRIATLGLALVALAVPTAVAAQVGATTDIITGVVAGPDGEPLEEAVVQATSLETQITRAARTDRRGRYTILFPDGGGQYQMAARAVGMTPQQGTIVRQADEDRLVWSVRLASQGFALEEITVRGQRTPLRVPELPTPGSTERQLSPEQVARLPIDPTDFNILATLVPGVVGLEGTDSTSAAFSVAGQRPSANAIQLDGLTFGGASVPQEAIRSTRVVTNTYDVARGQFSGGLVASTTRSGTNVVQGNSTYTLRDDDLSVSGDPAGGFGGAFTQHRMSGGLGGPIARDRLFVFGALQGQFRDDRLESLLSANAATLERLGVHPDSVARFLGILASAGVPGMQAGVRDARANDNLSALLRFDYILSGAHTLTLRGDWRGTTQAPSRLSPLALPQTGGTMETSGGGVMMSLASRFGTQLIHEARAYLSTSDRTADPYVRLPEGRVQVASELSDGARSVTALSFGGNIAMPQQSSSTSFEATDELSWISGNGRHRIKLGGLFNVSRPTDVTALNRFGSFRYNSLEDLEAGRPASFSRTLTPSARPAQAYGYAAYLADVWRATPALQLTYGVRLEGSSFGDAPVRNADLESRFGLRTDRLPGEWHLSPRAGFTWTPGMPAGAPPRYVIRGGIGEFRSPVPTSLSASVQNATGLGTTESQIVCIRAGTPAPDWGAYGDAGAIPTSCLAGGPSFALASPNATVFAGDFEAPRAWRASLGVQRSLSALFRLSVDGSYARGIRQFGFADRNLVASPRFTLSSEAGRPVFVDPAGIDPGTGAVGLAGSRRDPAYGQVFVIGSDLESDTKQITVSLNGITGRGALVQTSYTFSRARDQSSFSCCSAAQGFSAPTTGGDPNGREWATSDFERRHAFLASVTWPFGPALELTTIGRLTSGTPFTPRVGSDLNGDGARNDRAFIFDPADASQPEVASGMRELLASSSGRVRDCLDRQQGRVAERNSCTGPWQASLDLQLNYRPTLLGLNRRLSLSLTTVNLLGGLDELFHGSGNLRGWGQPGRPDQTLLYVTGFDPATQSFRYAVNERFGATGGNANAFRSPFQIGIQARLTIGPDRRQGMLDAMRGAGRGAGGGAGRGGFGGPGMGQRGIGGGGDFLARFETLLPNPAAAVLERADSLGLNGEQRERLTVVADSAAARNARLAEEVRLEIEKAGAGPDPIRLMAVIRPRIQAGQANMTEALKRVREILTAEQWDKLPESIKTPPRPGAGPAGGGRGGIPPGP